MYVVTVEFDIKAEKPDVFRAQMIANAMASREKEPGCLQFDAPRGSSESARSASTTRPPRPGGRSR